MHRKPKGGTNKHGKYIITRSGKGKGAHRATRHGLLGVGCNHTTTYLLRASSVVKPRTEEANTSIKHRSKQVQTCKMGDPNPLMWAKVYGQCKEPKKSKQGLTIDMISSI